VRIRAYLSILSVPPMPVLIAVSLVAWLVLLQHGHTMHAADHHVVSHICADALTQLGFTWLIMLVGMMAPLLAEPIRQLWVRSLPRRRWMAIFLFVMAYATIWMLAGVILSMAAIQLQLLGEGGLTASILALAIVFLWQASPWKQVCLNYCHWSPRLSAFGLTADWDSWRFGIVKGFWCVGSCWALMFLPLMFIHASLPLMLAANLVLVIERCQPARSARWRIPFLGRV
jgi:predicted metal-binding membrane protein